MELLQRRTVENKILRLKWFFFSFTKTRIQTSFGTCSVYRYRWRCKCECEGMCECRWMRPRHGLKISATCSAFTRRPRLDAWSPCSSCLLTGLKSTTGIGLRLFFSHSVHRLADHCFRGFVQLYWPIHLELSKTVVFSNATSGVPRISFWGYKFNY